MSNETTLERITTFTDTNVEISITYFKKSKIYSVLILEKNKNMVSIDMLIHYTEQCYEITNKKKANIIFNKFCKIAKIHSYINNSITKAEDISLSITRLMLGL